MMDDTRGKALVAFARNVILHALGGPEVVRPVGAWFETPAATFVTVTRAGRLHGCIGSLAPRQSLASDVAENAIAAAFRDPRSVPFRADWVPDLGVEVTLLGPLAPMRFASEADLVGQLAPHVDGLVLRWKTHRGTFLPQVWESLEAPQSFFDELKVKAGLTRDFWAEDLEVSRFAVEKWHEA